MSIPCKMRPVGWTSLPSLPLGYTRLDFLACDGSQEIKTGFYLTGASRVEAKLLITEWFTGRVSWIFHAYNQAFWSYNYNGGYSTAGRFRYGTIDRYPTRFEDGSTGNQLNKVYDFVTEKGYIWRNGVRVSAYNGNNSWGEISEQEFTTDNPCSLFGGAKARFFSFKISENGEPKCNLIPALDATGTPCMFDTVTRTPFYSSGTGQFAAGMTLDQVISLKLPVAPAAPANKLTLSVPGEVMYRYDAQKALNAATANGWELTIQYRDIETPEFQGYVVADYIEKPTGAYTYINTGLSQRLLGYFDYMNTECNQLTNYSRSWGIAVMQPNSRGSWWVQSSDSKIWLYATTEATCPINTRHTLVHVLCARRMGDSSSRTYVGLGIDGNWSLYYPDAPIPDGVTTTYRMFAPGSTERLYSARFTDIEHKDIASFIPAIDPDGNPCMFDFVRKQPFYNANGTNKFAFTIGLTQEQAESLVLGDKGSGLTIQVPEGTDLDIMQANNPNVTITIQTIPETTN